VALWNTRAQRVPVHEYRARFDARQLRKSRRSLPAFATVGFAGALLLAVLGGAAIAVFSAPGKLIPVRATTVGPIRGTAPVRATTVRPVRGTAPVRATTVRPVRGTAPVRATTTQRHR
jgi:hypothetical protein